jgi:hypothetical protein
VITSPLTANGGVNTPFSFTITATGIPDIVFGATALPSGLVLSGDTITGAPLFAGSFVVHLTASNGAGTDHEDIVVQIAPEQDLSIEKVQAKINWAPGSTTADTLTAAFSVTLPAGLDQTKATMDVYFGALKWTGLATVKTKAVRGAPVLTVRPAASGSSTLMMSFKISNANLKALSQNGLSNVNATGKALPVPVSVLISTGGKSVVCGATANLLYTCKKDRVGTAKKAP